jgi:hypothetical protein
MVNLKDETALKDAAVAHFFDASGDDAKSWQCKLCGNNYKTSHGNSNLYAHLRQIGKGHLSELETFEAQWKVRPASHKSLSNCMCTHVVNES